MSPSLKSESVKLLSALREQLTKAHGLTTFPSLTNIVYNIKGEERFSWSTEQHLKTPYVSACVAPSATAPLSARLRVATSQGRRPSEARKEAFRALAPALVTELKALAPSVALDVDAEILRVEVSWEARVEGLEAELPQLARASDLVSRFLLAVLARSGG